MNRDYQKTVYQPPRRPELTLEVPETIFFEYVAALRSGELVTILGHPYYVIDADAEFHPPRKNEFMPQRKFTVKLIPE